jgi:hypothetical protein
MSVMFRENDLRSRSHSLFTVLSDFMVFARSVYRFLDDFSQRHCYGIPFDLDLSVFFK